MPRLCVCNSALQQHNTTAADPTIMHHMPLRERLTINTSTSKHQLEHLGRVSAHSSGPGDCSVCREWLLWPLLTSCRLAACMHVYKDADPPGAAQHARVLSAVSYDIAATRSSSIASEIKLIATPETAYARPKSDRTASQQGNQATVQTRANIYGPTHRPWLKK